MGARDAILDAAAGLAAEGGVLALGIEPVVRAAGVSKGSFFYHFRTKEEMVRALLEHVGQGLEADVEALMGWGRRYTDALVEATLDQASARRGLIAVVVAAIAIDPGLRPVVRARVTAWTDRMVAEDGLDRGRADLVRLVLDGVLLSSLLQDGPREPGWEERVRAEIARLAATMPDGREGA